MIKSLITSPIILYPTLFLHILILNLIRMYLITISKYLTSINRQDLFHSSGDFLTYTIRPKTNNKSRGKTDRVVEYSDVGVIVEGPFFSTNDFTISTLEWLLITFKNIKIVYVCSSKLKSSDIYKIDELNKQYSNFECIIKNKISFDEKWKFLPNQIESVNLGLDLINSDSKIQYIMKLRSDSRFYEINSIDYLRYIASRNKNKIIALSMNSFYNRLFSVNDMFHFAPKNIFNKFWKYSSSEINYLSNHHSAYNSFAESYLKNYGIFPELFLNSQYMLRLNLNYNLSMLWDLGKYREFVRSHYVLIDKSEIDYFWLKNRGLEHLLENDYEVKPKFSLAKNEFYFHDDDNDTHIS